MLPKTALPSSPNNRMAEAIRISAFVISESNLEQPLRGLRGLRSCIQALPKLAGQVALFHAAGEAAEPFLSTFFFFCP